MFPNFCGLFDCLLVLGSLCLDQAGEEVDEEDAECERDDVHDQEGEGPPVQVGHHSPTEEKQTLRSCNIFRSPPPYRLCRHWESFIFTILLFT